MNAIVTHAEQTAERSRIHPNRFVDMAIGIGLMVPPLGITALWGYVCFDSATETFGTASLESVSDTVVRTLGDVSCMTVEVDC